MHIILVLFALIDDLLRKKRASGECPEDYPFPDTDTNRMYCCDKETGDKRCSKCPDSQCVSYKGKL